MKLDGFGNDLYWNKKTIRILTKIFTMKIIVIQYWL